MLPCFTEQLARREAYIPLTLLKRSVPLTVSPVAPDPVSGACKMHSPGWLLRGHKKEQARHLCSYIAERSVR